MEKTPTLYLIPVPISEVDLEFSLPSGNHKILASLRHFFVENVRTARRFLKLVDPGFPIGECEFYELNRHTDPVELNEFLKPMKEGKDMGLMSEAGCPAVADPGALIVAMAHKEGFRVVPLVGPSSIILSLMASGFNGQKFCFRGYLPIEKGEKEKELRELEALSAKDDMTQIFIETPYRNNKLIETITHTLRPDTMLCVACNLTSPENEKVISVPVSKWKQMKYDFDKKPAIFLIYRHREERRIKR